MLRSKSDRSWRDFILGMFSIFSVFFLLYVNFKELFRLKNKNDLWFEVVFESLFLFFRFWRNFGNITNALKQPQILRLLVGILVRM